MKAIVTAVLVLAGAAAVCADDIVRYCATPEYLAVVGTGAVGQRLWVAPYPSAAGKPDIREVVLEAPVTDLRCVGPLVYLHAGTKTVTVSSASATPEVTASETPWEEIAVNHAARSGRVRPRHMYELPVTGFRLALTEASIAYRDKRDVVRALFFITPWQETQLFSVRYQLTIVD
jgi:hypothetical protein